MAMGSLALEHGPPMKPSKITPSAKERAAAKAVPVTQASQNSKAAPSIKNSTAAKAVPPRSKTKRVSAVTQDASAPQDKATPPVAHTPSEIALRAYHNYQRRGSADGDPMNDWLRAETELTRSGVSCAPEFPPKALT